MCFRLRLSKSKYLWILLTDTFWVFLMCRSHCRLWIQWPTKVDQPPYRIWSSKSKGQCSDCTYHNSSRARIFAQIFLVKDLRQFGQFAQTNSFSAMYLVVCVLLKFFSHLAKIDGLMVILRHKMNAHQGEIMHSSVSAQFSTYSVY